MITSSPIEQANCHELTLQLCARLQQKNPLAFDIFFATFEKAYSSQHRHAVEKKYHTAQMLEVAYEMLDAVWVECLMELRHSINTERAENEYCGRFGFDIFTDKFYDALTNIVCTSAISARGNA